MASTERTRSISGSGSIGLDDGIDHHHHQHHHHNPHPHHHHHHPQSQQQHPAASASDFGNMSIALFHNFASNVGDANSSSAMNLSQISAVSSADSALGAAAAAAGVSTSIAGGVGGAGGGRTGGGLSITHNVGGSYCRFPKLEECAHFHYERVQLGQILLRLVEDRSDLQSSSNASQHIENAAAAAQPPTAAATPSNTWFIIRVTAERSDPFLIRRSLDNLRMLDEMLHRCVYDRKISGLKDFQELDCSAPENLQLENLVAAYLNRFSNIMSDSLTCGPVLTWFQLDNKGRRLPLADMDTMKSINTPAVGAAYGIRKYQAQAVDEISIEVGDMISVIDMPSPAESTWWRGKKSHLQKSHYEVGFFPQTCVATIGDKVPRNLVLPAPLVGSLAVSPTKPVLRKHGKLIAFFRSFILSRPSRRRLKQSGIYKERVFSCDLSEHLLNSGQEIPMVLRCCAEFIEESGIVDGIYRLSGITSNIQKLRRSFDEERIPDFALPDVRQDIHAMSSLLKMYFRELPNPLCTFQLYDNFVDAIQTRGDAAERLRLMKETVQKLPPPHYRTLKYLAKHLNKISLHHKSTGMTDRNLAIVWAPNLLRSPALETGDDYISGVAALRGVGVQAVVTEYLITNCSLIFDAAAGEEYDRYESLQYDSLTDTESLQLEQRDHHDHSLFIERPKSLSVGGPKLISLEEAQTRRDVSKSMAIATPSGGTAVGLGAAVAGSAGGSSSSSYIEVGGGPSSLPDKYHTVLPVPRSWSKRKTHSWKSLFTRQQRPSAGAGVAEGGKKVPTISHPCPLDASGLGHPMAAATAAGLTGMAGLMALSAGGGAGGAQVIGGGSQQHISLRNGHEKLAAAKSIDLFDGGAAAAAVGAAKSPLMDLCLMRSASIDSLRTVGHSRSVSHDSYFDLLQSPLRSGGGGTCLPGEQRVGGDSRELSELGLNFDREEPEMRIFSESESLVSSPRPAAGAKEITRRSTRSRPDDQHQQHHLNTTVTSNQQHNGNNPSPKKQPRLHIPQQQLGSAATNLTDLKWCSNSSTSSIAAASAAAAAPQPDESSMCKRYKLEDQLSDIQYIDCATPEHCAVAQPAQPQAAKTANTLYAQAQVHSAPRDQASSRSSSRTGSMVHIADNSNSTVVPNAFQSAAAGNVTNIRYSYPGLKSRPFGHDAMQQSPPVPPIHSTYGREERFSYPGMGRRFTHISNATDSSDSAASDASGEHRTQPPAATANPKSHLGRFSYCDPHTAAAIANADPQLLLRSSSAEMGGRRIGAAAVSANAAAAAALTSSTTSKLSIPTPSTPCQSPRYSLLVGEMTSSSECSDAGGASAAGTPTYDMDVSQCGSLLLPPGGAGGRGSVSPLSLTQSNRSGGADSPAAARDLAQMKRELSLDLCDTTAHRMSLGSEATGASARPPSAVNLRSTPCTPNPGTETENTSQSVTPSEFGYQHLSRASRLSTAVSPALSLTSPKSPETPTSPDMYETMGGSFGGAAAMRAVKSTVTSNVTTSPIRSTINITYNLRSPAAPQGSATHENVFFCSTGSATSTMSHGKPQTDASADYELVSVVTVEAQPQQQQQPIEAETEAESEAEEARKPLLLETSFDADMVYEQVKFFKGAVADINSMLAGNGNPNEAASAIAMEAESSTSESVVPQLTTADGSCGSLATPTTITNTADDKSISYVSESLDGLGHTASGGGAGGANNSEESTDADVPMHDQELDDIQDSLELDPNVSMYENVELRRPPSVYENVDLRGAAAATVATESIGSPVRNQTSVAPRPTTFNVRQLANKFETTSPVEALPPTIVGATSVVDFTSATRPFGRRLDSNRNSSFGASAAMPTHVEAAKSAAQKAHILHGASKHTRSLDENAFVREFGAKPPSADMTKSVQAIGATVPMAVLPGQVDAIDGRRMSLEFTRIKTLNPPKRLPDLDGCAEDALCGRVAAVETNRFRQPSDAVAAVKYERITPTTENPISLIQANVAGHDRDSLEIGVGVGTPTPHQIRTDQEEDQRSLTSVDSRQSVKAIGPLKLDRERIEKIKEERRLQLNEKFRGGGADSAAADGSAAVATATGRQDSIKSKSKSRHELRDLKEADMGGVELRYKSKSRGDVRSSVLRDSRESLAHLATTTLQHQQQHRVRRISDEKNQNDLGFVGATAAMAGGDSVTSKARKFDGAKSSGTVGGGLILAPQVALTASPSRLSMGSQRERISPQFNIRDVAAMFESRSQQ